MVDREIKIVFQSYERIEQLDAATQKLCKTSETALQNAYAPYSSFSVGTAIELADGTIVQGSNQENVAYPSGLCAERVALFAIGATNPKAVIKKMVITASTPNFKIINPVTSCGACLQVMAEFEKKQNEPIQVLFYCLGGEVLKINSVKDLMPFSFVEERLSK